MVLADADLVAAACAGDVGSMAVLIERHRARMRAVAVSMLGPGVDSDDVVQDASLTALTTLHRLHDPGAAGAWLTGITRNLSRRAISARGRHVALTDALDRCASTLGDPARLLETALLADWLWHAINELSEPLRQVIVLRHFSQVSAYAEIAVVLGLPIGTVRSRLHEARRGLTTQLTAMADESHPDHAHLVAARSDLFTTIYGEYNRGDECREFRAALTVDAELRQGAEGVLECGRDRIGDWLQSDIDLGVQIQLHDLVAGKGITVIDGAFINPVELPGHCPPTTSHIYLHDGDGVAAVHLHFAADVAPEPVSVT